MCSALYEVGLHYIPHDEEPRLHRDAQEAFAAMLAGGAGRQDRAEVQITLTNLEASWGEEIAALRAEIASQPSSRHGWRELPRVPSRLAGALPKDDVPMVLPSRLG